MMSTAIVYWFMPAFGRKVGVPICAGNWPLRYEGGALVGDHPVLVAMDAISFDPVNGR